MFEIVSSIAKECPKEVCREHEEGGVEAPGGRSSRGKRWLHAAVHAPLVGVARQDPHTGSVGRFYKGGLR